MVKIVWTEVALNDIKEIFEYISRDSLRYANLTIHKIYQKVQILAVNPYTGKIVSTFNNPLIRELLISNYRTIYLIKSNSQVDILRVYHTSRLLKKRIIAAQ